MDCGKFRKPASAVSQMVAVASLELEHLSAAFMVDASQFFALKPLRTWPNLTSLMLTSRLLVTDATSHEIGVMLRAAAAAAMGMPKLQTMKIWNGRKGSATLFKYQSSEDSRQATITWRSTLRFGLLPDVIKNWKAVALQLGDYPLDLVEEWLDEAAIQSHGDAIHYLTLNEVIRPVSLQQIRKEQKVLG
ncbi:unnamed protein product [Discula destructiva]